MTRNLTGCILLGLRQSLGYPGSNLVYVHTAVLPQAKVDLATDAYDCSSAFCGQSFPDLTAYKCGQDFAADGVIPSSIQPVWKWGYGPVPATSSSKKRFRFDRA
jgi:hypothetical protein